MNFLFLNPITTLKKKLGLYSMSIIILISICGVARPIYADLFGGDVAVLTNILLQNIKQLYELQRILSTQKNTYDLLRDVNRGIKEALKVLEAINPSLYPEISKARVILDEIEKIYGKIPSNLPNTDMLKKNDETIISSFWMNESLNQYAQKLDEAGKAAQEEASRPYVSSLQAQKMTARTLGALLQALAQMQKNEAQLIILQAQNLGLKNRQEKLASEEFLEHSNEISNALRMTNNTTSLVRLK